MNVLKAAQMNLLEKTKFIRRLVIISLFADDDLMNVFVLKGGNAIDIIYGLGDRASIDIDVSMANDFETDYLEEIRNKLEKSLVGSQHQTEIYAR